MTDAPTPPPGSANGSWNGSAGNIRGLDLPSAEWNPLFREASGQVAVGARLTLESVRPANGRLMTVRPKVLAAEPARKLRWMASLPGVMTGEHSFTLSPADGGTRLVQSETFRGLLVHFSGTTISRIQPQFEALNQALKERAEGLGQDARHMGKGGSGDERGRLQCRKTRR